MPTGESPGTVAARIAARSISCDINASRETPRERREPGLQSVTSVNRLTQFELALFDGRSAAIRTSTVLP